MSSASGTSSKRDVQHEKQTAELMQELEAIRAMNSSLKAYLDHIRSFKKSLATMNNNYQLLSKVNSQWIETLTKLQN